MNDNLTDKLADLALLECWWHECSSNWIQQVEININYIHCSLVWYMPH